MLFSHGKRKNEFNNDNIQQTVLINSYITCFFFILNSRLINYGAIMQEQAGLDEILEAPESQAVRIHANLRNVAHDTLIQDNRGPVQQCFSANVYVERHDGATDDIEVTQFLEQDFQEQLNKYNLTTVFFIYFFRC